MKKKPAWLKNWKVTPAGLIARPRSEVETPVIMVAAARLQMGLWGLNEGDICAAYTADQRPNIRKPFEHSGKLWANWGGSESCVRCTPLTPLALAADAVLPNKESNLYEGEIVVWRKQEYICGMETHFVAKERGPGQIADLARRMFAFGGHFAATAGSYRNLLKKWLEKTDPPPTALERVVWPAELAADLPQTQEGMRILLGDATAPEPRRFNPLTGKAA